MDHAPGMAWNSPQLRKFLSVSLLAVMGFIAMLTVFEYIDPYPLKNWIHLRISLQQIGLSGLMLFILCMATMPLAAPLSLLIMAGSSAYGAPLGIVLSYVGCLINANLVYFLVKGLGLEQAWGRGAKGCRVKNAIQENGYTLVFILQLIPVVPFTLINSAAAASGVCWRDFMKATAFGVLPGIALFSLLGHAFVSEVMPPRFYFAFVCAAIFSVTMAALLKKNTEMRRKALSQTG